MLISWAGGTLLIGFDLGTTLIWLTLTILGPLLVWGFVAAVQIQTPSQSHFHGQPTRAKTPSPLSPQHAQTSRYERLL